MTSTQQMDKTLEFQKKHSLSQNEIADVFGITTQAASIFCKQHSIETFRHGNRAYLRPPSVRQFFKQRSITYPSKVISFQMLKGGSTKTSSAYNLAIRLHQYGAKVLALDLDMQGNFTDAFDKAIKEEPVFINVATGEAKIQDTILNIDKNLDLLPSDFENSTLDFYITSRRLDIRNFVADIIKPIRNDYDFIIIDCNPALSSLNISIALASDEVIIPVNPDPFSMKGLHKTVEEFQRVKKNYGKKINYNLLFTLFDGRESTSQKYLIEYGTGFKNRLYNTAIRKNADVKNALETKKSIFDFRRAPAREDFDYFARDILGIRK